MDRTKLIILVVAMAIIAVGVYFVISQNSKESYDPNASANVVTPLTETPLGVAGGPGVSESDLQIIEQADADAFGVGPGLYGHIRQTSEWQNQ
jgi:hypothetical protein